MLSSLCGAGQEILSLPLHTLQTAVSKEARMHTVEQVMVTAVNQVGPAAQLHAASARQRPLAIGEEGMQGLPAAPLDTLEGGIACHWVSAGAGWALTPSGTQSM